MAVVKGPIVFVVYTAKAMIGTSNDLSLQRGGRGRMSSRAEGGVSSRVDKALVCLCSQTVVRHIVHKQSRKTQQKEKARAKTNQNEEQNSSSQTTGAGNWRNL